MIQSLSKDWQEAIEHMANLIKEAIDNEIIKEVIEEAKKKEAESEPKRIKTEAF